MTTTMAPATKHEQRRKRGERAGRAMKLPRNGGLRLRRDAHCKRIDPDRVSDVLELGQAEVADREIEPPLDLAIGVLRQTDRAGLGDAFDPRGDIDAVAHQIAVRSPRPRRQMNADSELDALSAAPGVALDHAVLDLDRAAHRVDHAAKLDKDAVAGALDDAPAMRGNGGIDQVAAQDPSRDSVRSSSAPASRL